MMYPYMTLNDDTEIVHSELKPDGRVKVYIETPDKELGFRHATCWLPEYKWEDILGYSPDDIARFTEIVESSAHLIMRFAEEGASGTPRLFSRRTSPRAARRRIFR